jgi:hypothetical protein
VVSPYRVRDDAAMRSMLAPVIAVVVLVAACAAPTETATTPASGEGFESALAYAVADQLVRVPSTSPRPTST